MSRILSILRVTTRVPSSATPQAVVEWLEPTARTGDGYCWVSWRIETISSTEVTSTTFRGEEVMLPNQFCTGLVVMSDLLSALGLLAAAASGGTAEDRRTGRNSSGNSPAIRATTRWRSGATRIS